MFFVFRMVTFWHLPTTTCTDQAFQKKLKKKILNWLMMWTITSNYRQIWPPDWSMNFIISRIVEGVNEQNGIEINVYADDWTVERAIIASNDSRLVEIQKKYLPNKAKWQNYPHFIWIEPRYHDNFHNNEKGKFQSRRRYGIHLTQIFTSRR